MTLSLQYQMCLYGCVAKLVIHYNISLIETESGTRSKYLNKMHSCTTEQYLSVLLALLTLCERISFKVNSAVYSILVAHSLGYKVGLLLLGLLPLLFHVRCIYVPWNIYILNCIQLWSSGSWTPGSWGMWNHLSATIEPRSNQTWSTRSLSRR